ncbi:hypothetical protein DIPPA_25439 [Diplonema papillatum]|nr:hypothetical protein DIPPA_25439 [Diplonema papillatum]
MPWWIRLVLVGASCIAAAAAVPADARCGDAWGAYCGRGEACCYTSEKSLSFCCPAEQPVCCGSLCCGAGEGCLADCGTGELYCAKPPAGGAADSYHACAKTCCGDSCCDDCCSDAKPGFTAGPQPTCAPPGTKCCASYKAGQSLPAPFDADAAKSQLPAYCEAEYPVCCGKASEQDRGCCVVGSDCCSGCEADEACCGGCQCCGQMATCDVKSATCVPRNYVWLVAWLSTFWVLSIAGTLVFTVVSACRRYKNSKHAASSKFIAYIQGLDEQLCRRCGHEAHHGAMKGHCPQRTTNASQDCITCLQGCRRRGCHGRLRVCSRTYSATHKTHTRKGDWSTGSSVSVDVVNRMCDCGGCLCTTCAPELVCTCARCRCKKCRTIFDDMPMWSWCVLADAGALFLFSGGVWLMFGGKQLFYLMLAGGAYVSGVLLFLNQRTQPETYYNAVGSAR